jgi:hypothetical protein
MGLAPAPTARPLPFTAQACAAAAFPARMRFMRNMLFRHWIVALIGLGLLIGQSRPVLACPFCSAVSLTFAQEIAQSQAAAIVRLVEPPPAGALSPRAEGPLPKGKFAVVEVLKGTDLVAEAGHSAADGTPIETVSSRRSSSGRVRFRSANGPSNT